MTRVFKPFPLVRTTYTKLSEKKTKLAIPPILFVGEQNFAEVLENEENPKKIHSALKNKAVSVNHP